VTWYIHWNSPQEVMKRNREKCRREGHDVSFALQHFPEGAQTSCNRCRALVEVAPSGCLAVTDDELLDNQTEAYTAIGR
jgi:hypothetical protein